MKPMNIWQLEEYAQQHGFNTGHFLAISQKALQNLSGLMLTLDS